MVLLSAAQVLADDGFYVVGVGGKPVGKEITSLPATITKSGMYYLSQNLTHVYTPGNPNAIYVAADNVTLDLMGFTITGPGKTGNPSHCIFNNGFSGMEVRNGCITLFGGDGVHCLGTNCRVIGLHVTNVGAAGISENGQNQVISCFACSCGHEGIWSGGQSMLKGNTVNSNAMNGITAGNLCTVSGNLAFNNNYLQNYSDISTGEYCTVIDNSTHNSIVTGLRCTVARNTTYSVITGDNCTVANNTAQHGIIGNNCIADNNAF